MGNKFDQERATHNGMWIAILIGCCFLVFVALLWKEETLLITHRIIIIVCACVITFIYAFLHAIYSATISNHEIVCYYFNKEHCKISWNNIRTVMIVRDFRMNLGRSGNTRIVVIPNKCPVYDSKKWSGLQYIYAFRNQVIWIDNTDRNRKYVEEHWGKIENCR